MENIEKIKKAEEESEKIIKDAERKVKEMFDIIEDEVEREREKNEKKILEEIKVYKKLKDEEKSEKLKQLKKQKEEILTKMNEKEYKIDEIAEKIWEKIKKNIMQE
ncbi:MAG: hypothetical protein N2589_06075 [bacterium]|nr:hypothetical protein [bacterium]